MFRELDREIAILRSAFETPLQDANLFIDVKKQSDPTAFTTIIELKRLLNATVL